jgi:hypothetical protein
MALADDLRWFKQQFGAATTAALAGTPFTLDLIAAIAVQETLEVWGRARASHSVDDVLRLCVGDIIDAPGRGAFPKNRAALERVENGKVMFAIARQAIVDMATVATEYQKYLKNPNKLAHAFGIFQYDIQAFKEDPDFFLNKDWYSYAKCLDKCIAELEQKRKHVFGAKTELSDSDLVYVAIAYNKGSAKVGAGFKQGFKSGEKYYGELIDQYMQLSKKTEMV